VTSTSRQPIESYLKIGNEQIPIRWVGSTGKATIAFGSAESLSATLHAQDGPRDPDDPWNAHPERQPYPLRLVKLGGGPAAHCSPAFILFSPAAKTKSVTLRNDGNVPIRIGAPYFETNSYFELASLELAAGFTIPVGGSVTVAVTALGRSASDTLVFPSDDGTPYATLRLFMPAGSRMQLKPGLVVAIDFGTSNTSIFVIQTHIENAQPVAIKLRLPNGTETDRWPTEIFAPAGNRGSWRALSGLEQIGAGDKITNLKSLLRGDTVKSANGVSPELVLEFYLSQLLNELIKPHLRGIDPDGSLTTEFVFTVPVLDRAKPEGDASDSLYQHYVDRLLAAARRAGFEDETRGWSIATVLEPDGGALDILRGNDTSRQFKDGDRLLVLDCGGGTTDITLATIGIENGLLYFRDQRNVSATTDGLQFGGTVTTWLIGKSWVFPDLNYPGPLRPGAPPPEVLATRREANQVIVEPLIEGRYSYRADSAGWKRFDQCDEPAADGTYPEPSQAEPTCWMNRFEPLRLEFEKAKRKISNAITDQHPKLRFGNTADGDSDGFADQVPFDDGDRITYGPYSWEPRTLRCHYDRAVDLPVEKLYGAILQFLADAGTSPAAIQHVALIGGSSRLSRFREKAYEVFSEDRIVQFGPYVDIAVCRGASRKYDTFVRTLPVGFRFSETSVHQSGEPTTKVFSATEPGLALRARRVSKIARDIEPGEKYEVTLEALIPKEEPALVERFTFGPFDAPTKVLIDASVSVDEVNISFVKNGSAMPGLKLEY
jgi:hypothetical protein